MLIRSVVFVLQERDNGRNMAVVASGAATKTLILRRVYWRQLPCCLVLPYLVDT